MNKYRSQAMSGSQQATGASTDAFGKYGVVRETDMDRCIPRCGMSRHGGCIIVHAQLGGV